MSRPKEAGAALDLVDSYNLDNTSREGSTYDKALPQEFQSEAFVCTFKNNVHRGSMGRVGAAGDNARMESFRSLLQNNVLNLKKRESQEELSNRNRALD